MCTVGDGTAGYSDNVLRVFHNGMINEIIQICEMARRDEENGGNSLCMGKNAFQIDGLLRSLLDTSLPSYLQITESRGEAQHSGDVAQDFQRDFPGDIFPFLSQVFGEIQRDSDAQTAGRGQVEGVVYQHGPIGRADYLGKISG